MFTYDCCASPVSHDKNSKKRTQARRDDLGEYHPYKTGNQSRARSRDAVTPRSGNALAARRVAFSEHWEKIYEARLWGRALF